MLVFLYLMKVSVQDGKAIKYKINTLNITKQAKTDNTNIYNFTRK